MKKTTKAIKSNTRVVSPHRSFRRFVKNMFASLIKRQTGNDPHPFLVLVLDKLQEIEDSLEIIARKMVWQGKRGKGPDG